MVEKVKNLDILIDTDRMYVTMGNPIKILSVPRRGHKGTRRVEAETGIMREKGKLYFVKFGSLYMTNKAVRRR